MAIPIDRLVRAHATEAVLLDRIAELWQDRSWYRTHVGWIPEQQTEDRVELRLLVRLARKARALAAAAPDPITEAKAAADRDEFAGDFYVYPAGVGR